MYASTISFKNQFGRPKNSGGIIKNGGVVMAITHNQLDHRFEQKQGRTSHYSISQIWKI